MRYAAAVYRRRPSAIDRVSYRGGPGIEFENLLADAGFVRQLGEGRLFASVLKPHSTLSPAELERRCIGLVGAGEALSAAMVRGNCSEAGVADAFTSLIQGGLRTPPQ